MLDARSIRAPGAGSTRHLGRLSLRNYRNFEELDVELPASGVAVVGPNGSGKTNLLEAIYYLEVLRSFRGVGDSQLVRFGEDVFRIEGEVGDGSCSVAAAYDRARRIKRVEVDDREVERVSEGFGRLGVAVFRLEDADIIRGGPQERRRFLDVTLSLTEPGYLTRLQRYRALLGQRNEALRRGATVSELSVWSDGLVETGASIAFSRERWVAEGNERYARYYETVSGGDEASIEYVPSVGTGAVGPRTGDDDPGAWVVRFRRALEASADRERRSGMTVVGPHRDELRFPVHGTGGSRDLRRYGSSGQQRTAALALRLLEADRLKDHLGLEPVYLLDDVFAELDEDRSRRLLELFETDREGQVILTAPKAEDVTLPGRGLARWRMEDGRLSS